MAEHRDDGAGSHGAARGGVRERGQRWLTPEGAGGSNSRRAERRVYDLHADGGLPNGEILIYLNRLSDLLWLFARWVESK